MTGFTTPAEVSAYTNGLIAADDSRLPVLIDGASQAIRRYCGWSISPSEPIELTLDGDGTNALIQLPSLHVTEFTSLTVAGEDLAEADYEWSELGNLRLANGHCWPDKWRTIEAAFVSGYDTVDDLKQVVCQVVAMAISSPTGATHEQAGQVSMQWATTAPGVSGGLTLLDRDLAIINSYKLPGRV